MYRDPSKFRDHFKQYKDGKSVREIYGLPGYSGGKFDAATKKKIDYYYKLLRNNGFDMMSAVGILGNEYDTTPLKTYAGGKVADYNEPVITQGRAGSRLDKVDRMMDPDEDDDIKTRVAKRVGKGFASLAKDAKEWLGLETVDRFATHTQRPSDYVDATLIAAGNIMISKILNSSAKAFIKQYVRSFDDMDARALGEYFFREHPELMTKPQEAWYGELAKKQNSYFLQAIHRRSRAFQKEGVTVNPESISSQLRPEIKIAHLGEKNKYGGIYSASDNTMLVNADRVKDPRTAMRVTGHEDAHAMQTSILGVQTNYSKNKSNAVYAVMTGQAGNMWAGILMNLKTHDANGDPIGNRQKMIGQQMKAELGL